MNCRILLFSLLASGLIARLVCADENAVTFQVDLRKAHSGFDGKTCWVHARAGAIPPGTPDNSGGNPLVVMTMQKLLLTGSDVFYTLNSLSTSDLSKTWSEPVEQPSLTRHTYHPDGIPLAPGAKGFESVLQSDDETVLCDFTPAWHAASQTLLGIGHTAWYRDNRILGVRPRHTGYSVYDAKTRRWGDWKTLELPEDAGDDQPLLFGAGCVQRFDLENGDILLPMYGHALKDKVSKIAVFRCRFDGQQLSVVERGGLIEVPSKRGPGEPSLTRFQGKFFLTIRHDDHGYVSVSDDGLNFSAPRQWTFDDGTDLGNYNTQQHWVTHSDGLFLVYTRRGANNDHVFRHRAPLFIAQVDPEKLHVLRQTEQAIVPERGARLGNFGVVDVSPGETWVTAAEWMQPKGVEQRGSDNTVYVARLLWSKPNQTMLSKP